MTDRPREERLSEALYDVMTLLKERAEEDAIGGEHYQRYRTAKDICEQNGLDPVTAQDADSRISKNE